MEKNTRAVPFGGRTEMFVDDYLAERLENARFEINRPERKEEVLRFEKKWEGRGSLACSVFRREGQVYLYYRGYPDGADDASEMQTACLALSGDGKKFRRAAVDRIPYGAIRRNNIVWMGPEAHNFLPFYDNNPACPQDERFKAVAGTLALGGLFAFCSADGVRWRKMSEKPVITRGAFDSLNTAFYDARAGLYRCYSRYWLQGGFSGLRAIQSCVSDNFLDWSDPEPNRYGGGVNTEHYYTNAAAPVPGAEHVLAMFPMRFVPDRKKVESHPSKGVSDAVFLTSRDGVNWSDPFKTAWIPPSLDERTWTQRNFITASGIVETDGCFSLYVEERYMWDDCAVVRYEVPAFRFGCVSADARGGFLLTRPLVPGAAGLTVNYATSAAGALSAAATNPEGEPLDGFGFEDCGELYGNETRREVRWGGKPLDALRGRVICLRFMLRDARLYAAGSTGG